MRRNRSGTSLAAALLAGLLGVSGACAQDAAATQNSGTAEGARSGRRGEMAGMQRVMGEVSAVNGNSITLKSTEGGTVEVVTTENTRVREDRGPVHVSDLHPGDGLMAIGNRDPNAPVLHAAMIFAQTAAEIKAMRDNLGKTYITGRVTAIDLDNARMTVERADRVSQVIGFDETTSFRRAQRGGGNGGPGGNGRGGDGNGAPGGGAPPSPEASADAGTGPRSGEFGGGGMGAGGMGLGGMTLGGGMDRAFNNGESITLADIKVGDNVAGTGGVKNGVFVPTRLVDGPPRGHRRPGSTEGSPAPSSTAGPR